MSQQSKRSEDTTKQNMGQDSTLDANSIAYCKIYPPIGIARLGNSPEPSFIGPEIPGNMPIPENGYKDGEGRIRKQAARFRLYGFSSNGKLLGEVTATEAKIQWQVQLANQKAEWWNFGGAENVTRILETGQSAGVKRNKDIPSNKRHKLIIGPDSATIGGKNSESNTLGGYFLDYKDSEDEKIRIELGQLKTDELGRLLVLGSQGLSDSTISRSNNPLTSYANNDRWFDDISDGPVTAQVRINSSEVPVKGQAWVIVASPDFTPFTHNIVTLWDVMLEQVKSLNLNWPKNEFGSYPDAKTVSFMEDIYPILKRTSDYRWVSQQARRGHGKQRGGDFSSIRELKVLSNPKLASKPNSLHKRIFQRIRNPYLPKDSIEAQNQANLYYMPQMAGDEGDVTLRVPESWMTVTKSQYDLLKRWSDGDFVDDVPDTEAELVIKNELTLEKLPLEKQLLALTRAPLEACQGGAFYPGIEITSIVRHKQFYNGEAFRVSRKYQAGDITKWMALPWQADFYECRDHWWPAVRPDTVVIEAYLQTVESQFDTERDTLSIYELLVRRFPWARGVGNQFISRPSLPEIEPGQDATEYKKFAESILATYSQRYLRSLPFPRSGELGEAYRRRLNKFLAGTIAPADDPIHLPEVELKCGQSLEEYFSEKALPAVQKYLEVRTVLNEPRTLPGGTLITPEEYRASLLDSNGTLKVNENPSFQGIFDAEWRVRNRHAGKNDMVSAWSELGFVVSKQTASGETVLVETEREIYGRLDWREYFYYLMNIEQYPDFMPKAQDLAEEFLRQARELLDTFDATNDFPMGNRFQYSEITLDARLEQIYEDHRRVAEVYNPATDSGSNLFTSPERVLQRIRQLAPFNQLDGAWLQRITAPGPHNKIQGLLFQIWSDEVGNGDPALNHANIYTDLMQSAGIYMPPLNSRDYADNPELWDLSFSGPVYHSAISLFPETYFPELLGMTLYLEWESNELQRIVELYDYYGHPSIFYKLHVAIDNAVDGHANMSKVAVKLYLDEIRRESGDVAVQEHWDRIWTGYTAFKFGGGQNWRFRFEHPPTIRQQVVMMMEEKRHYGELNHHKKKLGPAHINSLFAEPWMFMQELEQSDYITSGDPENSRFFKLAEPTGPMYKVFEPKELALWKAWVRSLAPKVTEGYTDIGREMMILLRIMAARAIAAPEHGNYPLKGKDPNGNNVAEPVTWWFQLVRSEPKEPLLASTHFQLFMEALADPQNGLVSLGDPNNSRLVTEFLGDGPMGASLRNPIGDFGGKRGYDVITQWITENCPMPQTAPLCKELGLSARQDSFYTEKSQGTHEQFVSDLEEQVARRPEVDLNELHNLALNSDPRIWIGSGMGALQ